MDKNLEFRHLDTIAKIKSVLEQNKGKNIVVSNSGGKDSETMLSLLSEVDTEKKLKYIFFDTGIEFEATKRFLKSKQELGFNIEIIRAFKPVPLVVKQKGQPFISKYVSDMLERLQTHNFDFINDGNKEYSELSLKYPKCLGGLRWWCNYYGSVNDTNIKNQTDYSKSSKSSYNIARNRFLKEFLLKYGLPFKVSAKCCYYSKKMTSHHFEKENKIDLNLVGVRKAEGGIRATKYKSCFSNGEYAKYFPLFWWSNDEVNQYAKEKGLKFSDCYEVYGLKRTGCAGCPFGKNLHQEREVVKVYETNLSKAIENIFKDTYLWTEKYRQFIQDNTLYSKEE